MVNRWELRMALRNYCIENELCTMACNIQYERILDSFADCDASLKVLHRTAAMIKICSITDKTFEDLEDDLETLYLNIIQ